MKKIGNIIVVLLVIIVITGCGKSKDISINDSVTKIHALGDLVTYETYFHNVAKSDKDLKKIPCPILQCSFMMPYFGKKIGDNHYLSFIGVFSIIGSHLIAI